MDPPPVQYVTSSDGFRIAYCVSGEGRPLLFISPDFMDIQQVWHHHPDWMAGLAARFRLIQYDPRGTGLSTRGLPESLTLEDYVRDLETEVERLSVQPFLIWSLGGMGLTAIRYATLHAERVAALILVGPGVSGQAWGPVLYRMLPNEDWERFLRSMIPAGLTMEDTRAHLHDSLQTTTLNDWNAHMRCIVNSNVESDLQRLPMPALVMRARYSMALPAEESMKVAALIPNSRFAVLDAEFTLEAAVQGLEAIDNFVRVLPSLPEHDDFARSGQDSLGSLSLREIEVLRLVALGRSNRQIADELVITLSTVTKHIGSILGKTASANRTEAAVYARDRGIG